MKAISAADLELDEPRHKHCAATRNACKLCTPLGACLAFKGIEGAISAKKVTYDFARQMEGGTEIKCSAFGGNIIAHM